MRISKVVIIAGLLLVTCLLIVVGLQRYIQIKYPRGTVAAGKQDAVYYVSPDGSDLHPGTKARPWKTPARAFATAEAGDTVYFKTGTYDVDGELRPTNDGTASAPIIFADDPRDDRRAILRATNPALTTLIDLSKRSNIVIEGIEVTQRSFGGDYGAAMIRIGDDASHITLKDLIIHDTGRASAIRIGGGGGFGKPGRPSVTDVAILGGEIYNVGGGANRESIMASRALGLTVKDVYIHDGYADLLHINRVDGAVIDGVKLRDPLEGGRQHEDGLHIYWSYNITVKNSMIQCLKESKTAVMVGYGEGVAGSGSKNIRFDYSSIQSRKEGGALDINGASGVAATNCVIAAAREPLVMGNPDELCEQTDAHFEDCTFLGNGKWMYAHDGNIQTSGLHNTFYTRTAPSWVQSRLESPQAENRADP